MIVFDTVKRKYSIISKIDFKNEAKYYEYIVQCKFGSDIVKPTTSGDIKTKINHSFGDRENK